MRLLFTMDAQNYPANGTRCVRPSARGILRRDGGKLAMVHALKHNYYKFPGGGIEPGEDPVAALLREVREEAGLQVLRESIEEYGRVLRIEKGCPEDVFVQENFYYFCETAAEPMQQALTPAEAEEGFALEIVSPEQAVAANLALRETDYVHHRMALREALVLQLLLKENLL